MSPTWKLCDRVRGCGPGAEAEFPNWKLCGLVGGGVSGATLDVELPKWAVSGAVHLRSGVQCSITPLDRIRGKARELPVAARVSAL